MNDHLLESPEELKSCLPLSKKAASFVALRRAEVLAILQGKDPRTLLILGPCSIHNVDAGLEYARRLKKLSQEVEDTFLIVMRTYFEKPRTSFGWKGLCYDPHLDGSNDVATGVRLARSFLIELAEMQLAAATEFLEPLTSDYLADLITWGSIGARTVQSPIHREIASSLPMPIGFKNRNDGNIEIAVQAAAASKEGEGHAYLGIGQDGKVCVRRSSGNIFPHIVLRGSEEADNLDQESQREAVALLESYGLPPALVIDTSHGNARKNYRNQITNFNELMEQKERGNSLIRGIMLESNLLESTQSALLERQNSFPHLHPHSYSKEEIAFGASLTDPCLDWQTTEKLIKDASQVTLTTSLSLANI